MKATCLPRSLRPLLALTVTHLACAQTPPAEASPAVRTLDPAIVQGAASENWALTLDAPIDALRHRAIDGAGLIGRTPGAAVVRNGSQTGIAQLRGLSGDRVRVSLDGMCVSPACPNQMDPPLHYASAGTGTRVQVIPGIAPVRFGGDQIGGVIRVIRPDPVFAEASPRWTGELGGRYFGSHDGYGARGEAGWSGQGAALGYRGGWSTAGDLHIPDGRVRASGFEENQHHDFFAAARTANGYLSLDGGLTRTRDAGTPSLPMDMVEADSWHAALRHRAEFDAGTVESRLYFHDIDHLMDNFSMRPAPMMRMEAPSTSRDYGLRSALRTERGDHLFRVGIDLHRNDFDADQVQVATGARRDMFADNQRTRLGLFGEWELEWTEAWGSHLGVRADAVETKAGQVQPGFGPPPVFADAAAFNVGDRSRWDMLVDLVAAVDWEPDEHNRVELAFGIKNRAPSLLERNLWTPLSASAGRADGRTYLGDVDLDPETSFQLAATASHHGDGWSLRFTPFYNHVHNYIQGSPINRPDESGRPVLQFTNFDRVDLYGAELEGRFDFTDRLGLSGHLSYVRGRNRDTGDDLYRIAPLHGLVDLGWEDERWEAHFEMEWAASQNEVSQFNGEQPTGGYALLHLRTAFEFIEGLRLGVGVENLLDESYEDHLTGVNRVGGSDVPVGDRIPGAGRFLYADLSWEF